MEEGGWRSDWTFRILDAGKPQFASDRSITIVDEIDGTRFDLIAARWNEDGSEEILTRVTFRDGSVHPAKHWRPIADIRLMLRLNVGVGALPPEGIPEAA